MKTTYRIFSIHPFLTAIALFFLTTALIMVGWGIVTLFQYNLNYITTENIIFLPALLVVLLINVWLLSSSILPIVKIDMEGITAYSICWKRSIAWKDMKTLRFLKVKNHYSTSGTSINFEDTQSPEKKRIAVLNKGNTVNTFIVVSDKQWLKPQNIVIKRGLYNHHMIAGKYAIAFEYDQHTWEIINDRRNGDLY